MAVDGPLQTRVIIVGAGFGGIGLGASLKKRGCDDFIILEKSNSVGGASHHMANLAFDHKDNGIVREIGIGAVKHEKVGKARDGHA